MNHLRVADIELDPAAHTVRRRGVTVPLTAREFAMLHFLMDRAGQVVTRTELLEAVWDANYDGLSNVVDVHVANVRRKLDTFDAGRLEKMLADYGSARTRRVFRQMKSAVHA